MKSSLILETGSSDKHNGEITSKRIKMLKGVRQGCGSSPDRYNLHEEGIFKCLRTRKELR